MNLLQHAAVPVDDVVAFWSDRGAVGESSTLDAEDWDVADDDWDVDFGNDSDDDHDADGAAGTNEQANPPPSSGANKRTADEAWFAGATVACSADGRYLAVGRRDRLVVLRMGANRGAGGSSGAGASYSPILIQAATVDDELIEAVACVTLKARRGVRGDKQTCFLCGYNSGYIRLFDEAGTLLMAQILHNSPVLRLRLHAQVRPTTPTADTAEDLVILYPGVAVVIDGVALYAAVVSCLAAAERASDGSAAGAAADIALEYSKWELSSQDVVADVATTSRQGLSPFGLTVSREARQETRLLAVGYGPMLGYYVVNDEGNVLFSTIAMASSAVTKVTSAFFSMAKSIWRGGVPDPDEAATDADGNKKKKPVKTPAPAPLPATLTLGDRERRLSSIALAPDGRLGAVTDAFGRILLLDTAHFSVVRMWKGYREAQCAWLEVTTAAPGAAGADDSPRARVCLFLVIYAPRRALLEVWRMRHGSREAALNVGYNCRLIQTQAPMGTRGSPPTLASCYLLYGSGDVMSIDLSGQLLSEMLTPQRREDKHIAQFMTHVKSYAALVRRGRSGQGDDAAAATRAKIERDLLGLAGQIRDPANLARACEAIAVHFPPRVQLAVVNEALSALAERLVDAGDGPEAAPVAGGGAGEEPVSIDVDGGANAAGAQALADIGVPAAVLSSFAPHSGRLAGRSRLLRLYCAVEDLRGEPGVGSGSGQVPFATVASCFDVDAGGNVELSSGATGGGSNNGDGVEAAVPGLSRAHQALAAFLFAPLATVQADAHAVTSLWEAIDAIGLAPSTTVRLFAAAAFGMDVAVLAAAAGMLDDTGDDEIEAAILEWLSGLEYRLAVAGDREEASALLERLVLRSTQTGHARHLWSLVAAAGLAPEGRAGPIACCLNDADALAVALRLSASDGDESERPAPEPISVVSIAKHGSLPRLLATIELMADDTNALPDTALVVLGRFSGEVRHPDTAAAWRALLLADRWEAASADLSALRDAVASVASIRSGQLRAGVAHLLWSAHVRIRASALTALVAKVKRRPQNKACLEAVGVKAREVTTFLDHAVAVLELAVSTDDHDGDGPGPYRSAVVPDHWVAVGPAKDGLEEAMALGGAALAAGPGAEPLVAAHVTLIAVLSTVFHKRLKSVAPLSYFSPEVPFFGDLLSTAVEMPSEGAGSGGRRRSRMAIAVRGLEHDDGLGLQLADGFGIPRQDLLVAYAKRLLERDNDDLALDVAARVGAKAALAEAVLDTMRARMATLVVGLEASDDASVVLSLSQEVYTDICAWLPPAAGKARGRGRRDGVGSGGSYDQESAKITLDSTRRVLEAMTEWAAGGGDGAGADETREAISLLLAAAATLRGAQEKSTIRACRHSTFLPRRRRPRDPRQR